MLYQHSTKIRQLDILGDSISIYIHWPFCLSKCPYCDFNSHVSNNYLQEDWISSYSSEIDFFADLLKNKKVKSIFFGGGTPSLMNASLVEQIINKINKVCFSFENNIEISLEANPNSAEVTKFLDFKNAGINRISVGVQSLNESILKYLGRKHSVKEAIQAVENAKQHFDNVSMDIIYACKGHTLENWSAELQRIVDMQTSHLSLYQLTIEPDTKFSTLVNAGKMPLIEASLAYDLSIYTTELLKAKYTQYEISNYAKSGAFKCKHNINYWKYGNYIGIGAGAHSRLTTKNAIYAISNHRVPSVWQKKAFEWSFIEKCDQLNDSEVLSEVLFMGLRLNEGIKVNKIPKHVLKKITLHDKFIKMQEEQLVQINNHNIKLTSKGLMLHTQIVTEILCMIEE